MNNKATEALEQTIRTGGEDLSIFEIMQRFRNDGSCEHVIQDALIAMARIDPPAAPTGGVEIIRAERRRHFDVEGWTPEHDDEHVNGEIALAAACYAWPSPRPLEVKKAWPWELQDWKPELFGVGADDREKRESRIRVLAKAGALIAAEIDRLGRIK